MACECLKNLVVLRSLCTDRIDCQIYLDDLPNISYEAFANLTSTEKNTAAKLFQSVEAAAISSLSFRLRTEIKRKLGKARADLHETTGYFSAPLTVLAIADQFCGKMIRTQSSDFTEIHVKNVRLYSETAVSSAVYIYDMETHKLISMTAFTNQSGYFDVDIDKTLSSGRGIFIAYDRRAVASAKITTHSCGCSNGCCDSLSPGCSGSCSCVEIPNAFNPATTDLPLTSDCFCGSSDCGMSVSYVERCTTERMICANRDIIAPLLRLEMARTLWQDNRVFQAVNAYTAISGDVRDEILDYLKDEIEMAVPAVMEHFDADGVCYTCKGTRIVTMLP